MSIRAAPYGSTNVEAREVAFFKGTKSTHIALVNDFSDYGQEYNPWALELVRTLIDAQSVTRDSTFSIPDIILQETDSWAEVI